MNTHHITITEQESNASTINTDESVGQYNGSLDNITAYRGDTITIRKSAPMLPVSLDSLVREIRNDANIKTVVEAIRNLERQKTGDRDSEKQIDDQQNELKRKYLPYFTLGSFRDNHLANANLQSIKYDLQDLDHLGSRCEEVRMQLMKDPFVFVLFRSPRGNGLKVVREYDLPITDPIRFKQIHAHHAEILEGQYSIEVDPSTHDAARACFLSHDSDLFINPTHLLLQTDDIAIADSKSKKKTVSRERDELLAILGGVGKDRNSALSKLTGLWLDKGFDEDFIQSYAQTWNKSNKPPLPIEEVRATVAKICRMYGDPENLDRDFHVIRAALKAKKADDVVLTRTYFRWLRHNQKAQYFTDENDTHYVYFAGKLVPMNEKNADFNALLLNTANITTADKLGKIAVQVLNASAHLEGSRIERSTWLETRIEQLAVFLSLKNKQNELLKITPEKCEVVQNGSNEEGIFMLNTNEDKLKAVRFEMMDDERLREALLLGYDLVARHIPCCEEERWFAYGWRLAYPLYDFTTKHITLRAQGASSAGKSTASDVLSMSLYGQSKQGMSTTASLYRDAAINPLIIEDNLENKRFYADEGHGDFYLLAATGGMKQKSAKGSDSGVVMERIRALVLCNGIESVAKSEQTNRMMIIHCDKNKYNSEFTDAVFLDIKRHRDEMLSANFVLTQKVLKRIQEGSWHEIQKRLSREYPNHAKSRMFEHISLIILYLEEHGKIAGTPGDVWKLVKGWMTSQTESAFEEIIESDPIIQALDIVRQSAWKQFEFDTTGISGGDDRARLRSQIIKLDVETLLTDLNYTTDTFAMHGTAGSLHSAFSKAFQLHLNKQFPITNGRILAQRINEVSKELDRHGYMLTIGKDSHNDQKIYNFEWIPISREKQIAGGSGNQETLPAEIPADDTERNVAEVEEKE